MLSAFASFSALRRLVRRGFLLGSVLCGLSVPLAALDCRQISQLTALYLQQHYSQRTFTDAHSQKALHSLFEALDPGKIYFRAEDIAELEGQFGARIDDLLRVGDCAGINAVLTRYDQRFSEWQPMIRELISLDHDFTVEEKIQLDREKLDYPMSVEEQRERWRLMVKFQMLRLLENGSKPTEAREKLVKRYELQERYLRELKPIEVSSIYMNAIVDALDPHSGYLSPDDLADFNINMGLSLEGIGATLRSEDGVTTVQDLVPGGPAERSGLVKTGDRIIAVAQGDEMPEDVIDMRLRDVVKKVRGARGTTVKLTVLRKTPSGDDRVEIALVRDKIVLSDSEAKGWLYPVEMQDATGATSTLNVGVIRLPSFYRDFAGKRDGVENARSAAADVRRLITELKAQGMESLVLDLRFNTGGSLIEAVDLSGLFIDQGPVVQVRSQNGGRETLSDTDPEVLYGGPLVVMINRQSASASEIFAGAMKDYGRAVLVGDAHSFGKGTVQRVDPLLGGQLGAMRVTIQQFFRPSGSSTQLRGVEADVVLPDIVDELEIGEKFEDNPLPWVQIDPVPFVPVEKVEPHLVALRTASQARVALDDDFAKIRDEIAEYRSKADERGQVSLKWSKETPVPTDAVADATPTPQPDESATAAATATETTPASDAAVAEGEAAATTSLADEETAVVVAAADPTADAPAESATRRDANERPKLKEDALLREAVAVAADYLQIMNQRPLAAVAVATPEGNVRLSAIAPTPVVETDVAQPAVEARPN